MLIQQAYATEMTVPATAPAPGSVPTPPSASEAFVWNMGMVLVLVVLFYLLLIKPQQKRFREHSELLAALKKGDRVLTGGGLIGTIDKIGEGDEVVIDLGNGVKVTALRSSIQGKDDPSLRKKAANDQAKEQAKN